MQICWELKLHGRTSKELCASGRDLLPLAGKYGGIKLCLPTHYKKLQPKMMH